MRKEGNTTILRSYRTDVAAIVEENDGKWVVIFGLYSPTTRRHISYFVEQYAGINYHVAKAAYENDVALNVDTNQTRNLKWFVENHFFPSHYNYGSEGFHVYVRW